MTSTESHNFYDPHASKRRQIDHQILLLQQQIQKLQVERNALVPISSIPNEILSYIFLLCRGTSIKQVSMRALLRMTWVCRHWRDVALLTASLWAYVGIENLSWVEACLTRSREALLESYLYPMNSPPFDIGALLASLMHRFRHLCVRPHGDFSESFLTQPAPRLESLYLQATSTPIPEPLFSGIFPSLHSVSLFACSATSWTSSTLPFTNLKHLSLEHCNSIPVKTFIECLPPSLPNLETLVLCDSLTRSPATTTPFSSRIYLSNLKNLRIRNCYSTCITEFFESCSLIPSTVVKVYVNTAEDETETAPNLLHLVQASKTLEHRTIVWMQIYHEGENSQTFHFKALRSLTDNAPSVFDFIHGIPWPEISPILRTLPVQHITTLFLMIPELSLDDWRNVFVRFVHLEELSLEEDFTVQSFINFMSASTPDNGNGTGDANMDVNHNLPFKFLQKLRLCKGYFQLESDEVREDWPTFCS
ncbi:hypothetical protein BDN72DRAFT_966146, partial [Pluteus cervinus]